MLKLIPLIAAAALACASTARAEVPGVTDKEILLGQSVAYSGPAAGWGSGYGKAMQAFFATVNAKGGVNGRQIRFLSEDDAFTPPKAMENVRRLIEKDKVFALVGNMGTPTNLATYRYVNQKQVPNLFVMSGLSLWNDPKNLPWTTPIIPDYTIEGRAVASYIRAQPDARVTMLSGNDDNGREYDKAIREGLGSQVSVIVGALTSETTDPTVDSQVVQLAATKANIFFIGGTPRATAQAIRKADELGWKPTRIIVNPSASVAATLQPAGLERSTGVLAPAFLKDPTDLQWASDPGMQAYLAWLKTTMPGANPSDLQQVLGYTVADLTVRVLTACGSDLTRENLMRQVSSLKDVNLPLLLPGIRINTSPDDFRPIRQFRMQRFNGKEWTVFGNVLNG